MSLLGMNLGPLFLAELFELCHTEGLFRMNCQFKVLLQHLILIQDRTLTRPLHVLFLAIQW